jgi:hypothetical protein
MGPCILRSKGQESRAGYQEASDRGKDGVVAEQDEARDQKNEAVLARRSDLVEVDP